MNEIFKGKINEISKIQTGRHTPLLNEIFKIQIGMHAPLLTSI